MVLLQRSTETGCKIAMESALPCRNKTAVRPYFTLLQEVSHGATAENVLFCSIIQRHESQIQEFEM